MKFLQIICINMYQVVIEKAQTGFILFIITKYIVKTKQMKNRA